MFLKNIYFYKIEYSSINVESVIGIKESQLLF